jgi:hypothetical protein
LHFFPSLTEEKLLAMTPQKTKFYVQAMDRIRGKERLYAMEAAQYPHIRTQTDKNKEHRKVYKAAFPDNFSKRVLKTTELELF